MQWMLRIISVLLLCLAVTKPAAAQFKAEVKKIKVGEVELAYYIRGTGKPLVMINGFISTMSLWDPALLEKLAQHHQLILFDNRGVGLSTDTKENHTTMAQMADDTAELIKKLGYDKVDVLAWSMGARIGQQLLIRHPEIVNKAILCSASPGGKYTDKTAADVEDRLNNPNVPDMEKIGLVYTDDDAGKLAAKNTLSRLRMAVKDQSIPDDFKVSKETMMRQNHARTVLWDSDNANYLALKNINNPVLMADGRNDIIDLPKNSKIIANQIPYAWLAYLPGGHAFLFQSYGQFADLVDVFLL